MAINPRLVSDVLRIMRNAISRKNENDPDSNDDTLLRYLNDFISMTMSDDVKLFEQFGTLTFTIDENTSTSLTVVNGVITLDDACAQGGTQFHNISQECYISLLEPKNNSVSWNYLPIYQDPGEFFAIWGIDNEEILIPGYPTNLLYYGNEFTFRTIPNTSYLIKIYGYKQNSNYKLTNEPLQFNYWLRYLAYGAAANYVRDFNYDGDARMTVLADFNHERKLMLTHTHNQIKQSRSLPRF